MCSKKCAKPDFPGSTSLRDPTDTAIWSDTTLAKPVGTMMTRRPLASVRSVGAKGRIAPEWGSATSDIYGGRNWEGEDELRRQMYKKTTFWQARTVNATEKA